MTTSLYQSQRAMRNQRQAALQRGVIAVLDVGTENIECFVLRFDGAPDIAPADGVRAMAGQSRFRVVGVHPTRSRGVKFGEIDQMEETERAIRTAVQGAQKMAGVRVDHVIACFSGGRPRSYGLSGEVGVQEQIVSEHDIARVLAACDLPDYGAGRQVIHALPVNFALDHRSGLNDPRGQIGNRLAVDMHMLTVDAAAIENILYCIKRCDLELAGIASSAYLSGMSSMVEDEQELGAACVDFGAGTTGISIFIHKHLIFSGTVRLGGAHITSDISMGLQIPMAMAEKIKTRFGGLEVTGRDHREMIDIGGETGDWELDRRQVSRSELIGVMRPRVEEILEEVRAHLDGAGFEHLPGQRIVLTGAGSQIAGLDQLASRILGGRVRLGRPLRIQGLPQSATGPGYSALVGLCLTAAYPQDECWDFEIPADRYGGRSVRRAVKWFRENW